MLKALLKKQLFEMVAYLFGGKVSEKRSRTKLLLYAALFLYAFGSIGFMVYMMMSAICEPLVGVGYGWLYFSLAGIFAFVLGVFGSVFTTKSQLYEAKDNELLLAMPIMPSILLFSRLVGIFIITFFLEAVILIPAEIVYIGVSGNYSNIAQFIFILLLLPIFSMVFSCLLGWLVAIISAKMKRRNLMTIVLSLAFLAVYFYLYSQMQKYLSLILANAEEVGSAIKTVGFPIYQLGLATEGSFIALIFFALLTAILFGGVYLLLSHSFIKIAINTKNISTNNKSSKNKIAFSASTLDSALLKKEFARFISSPVYMLNCSLGTLMFIVGTVALIIKSGDVLALIENFNSNIGALPTGLITGAMLCTISSMNDLTAPSISLEGKTLWQVKSLPIPAWRFFRSKLMLHSLLTVPPLCICAAAIIIIVKPNPAVAAVSIAASIFYTLLCALFGLFLNLKMPRFDWSNEVVAVKQSASVVIALLTNWVFILLSVGIYILLGDVLGELGTAAVCALMYFAACCLIGIYLKQKSEKILLTL